MLLTLAIHTQCHKVNILHEILQDAEGVAALAVLINCRPDLQVSLRHLCPGLTTGLSHKQNLEEEPPQNSHAAPQPRHLPHNNYFGQHIASQLDSRPRDQVNMPHDTQSEQNAALQVEETLPFPDTRTQSYGNADQHLRTEPYTPRDEKQFGPLQSSPKDIGNGHAQTVAKPTDISSKVDTNQQAATCGWVLVPEPAPSKSVVLEQPGSPCTGGGMSRSILPDERPLNARKSKFGAEVVEISLKPCNQCFKSLAPGRLAMHTKVCKGNRKCPAKLGVTSPRTKIVSSTIHVQSGASIFTSNPNTGSGASHPSTSTASQNRLSATPEKSGKKVGTPQEGSSHHIVAEEAIIPATGPPTSQLGSKTSGVPGFQDLFSSQLKACSKCRRTFAPHRIKKHFEVCKGIHHDAKKKQATSCSPQKQKEGSSVQSPMSRGSPSKEHESLLQKGARDFHANFQNKLRSCKKCGRKFVPGRLETHENACKAPPKYTECIESLPLSIANPAEAPSSLSKSPIRKINTKRWDQILGLPFSIPCIDRHV